MQVSRTLLLSVLTLYLIIFGMPYDSKGYDWEKARQIFVEQPNRPTYEELAAEIGCAPGSLARLSSEQGWPALRAQHMERQLVAADASAVLLEAVKADRTILTGFTSLAIVMIAALTRCVESVEDDKAPQTKAQALNTCAFAMKNCADGLRAVGLIGISKTLDTGKDGNGRWNPEMLQQINVTVQNLQAQAKPEPVQVTKADPPGDQPSVPNA